MWLPASTQAVPDTCRAAAAISSPAEPLYTQKSPGKTSVTTPGSEHALCLRFCLTPAIRLEAGTPVGNLKSPPLQLGQWPQHGSKSSSGPDPTVRSLALGHSQAGGLTHLLSLKRIRWLCSRMAMRALGSYSVGLRKARPSGSPCTASSPGSRSSRS